MPKPLTLGEVSCGADGEGKDAAKEPDTQRYAPCLSEPSYRNAAGVISPGLPSQALTRQLPQSGSPWQRGVVFDETDLRFAEKRHGMPKPPTTRGGGIERSRDGDVRRGCHRARHTALLPCLSSHRIATPLESFRRANPLRRWRASSPKVESPWQRGVVLLRLIEV